MKQNTTSDNTEKQVSWSEAFVPVPALATQEDLCLIQKPTMRSDSINRVPTPQAARLKKTVPLRSSANFKLLSPPSA